jgi:hypothetical protein
LRVNEAARLGALEDKSKNKELRRLHYFRGKFMPVSKRYRVFAQPSALPDGKEPLFSAASGISRRAAEFVLCRGKLILPRNSAELVIFLEKKHVLRDSDLFS